MEANEMESRTRDEGGQALEEFQRGHDEMGGAIAIGRFELEDDLAGRGAAQAFVAEGRTRAQAEAGYRQFVSAGRDQPRMWDQLQQQMYLGSETFIRQAQRRLPTRQDLTEVPRVQRRAPPKPLAVYAQESRDRRTAMAQAFASGGYTLKAIADYFGAHYSTVSRAVKNVEAREPS